MAGETGHPDGRLVPGGVFAGILLLSAAVLAFEVYLTRVYSLMVWPYMAFVVVSVALLGIGAAGAALMLCCIVSRFFAVLCWLAVVT